MKIQGSGSVEVPNSFYAMVAGIVVAALIVGAVTDRIISASVSHDGGKVTVEPPDVNRVRKADRIIPTFDQRYKSVPQELTPSVPPLIGPIVIVPDPWLDPRKREMRTKVVANYYYLVRPKEQGDAGEVELIVEKRQCVYPREYPPACRYPQEMRWMLPQYRFN